jgi:predicted transcriptional regulator of viral defense system
MTDPENNPLEMGNQALQSSRAWLQPTLQGSRKRVLPNVCVFSNIPTFGNIQCMNTRHQTILELAKRKGLLRPRDLQEVNLPRTHLAELVGLGELVKVSDGIYACADRTATADDALAEVAIRYPRAVFCLLTAMRLHGLTTQAPHQVWVAVDVKARAPVMAYPSLRVVRMSDAALSEGVAQISLDGVVQIPVTSVAKTVVDAFKYRNKIGLDVALEALREAWQSKRVSMDELWHFAQLCRVANVMRPYLESLS